MLRLIIFLIGVLGVSAGLIWLHDRPGLVTIQWQGTEVEISVFITILALVLTVFLLFVAWSIFRTVWQSPATVGQFFKKRRQARGLDALSSGMIAIGSGDREGATRYAIQARKALPNEPLTHLLRAQAAQLTDDRATSRRIYEGMLGSRDTEALGLRGLFLEAQKEGEAEAAKQFAERALKLNPQLAWASDALFDMQCKQHDWPAALETLASARKNGLVAKPTADRRRAILLTAQAQIAEDSDPDKALSLAQEAHSLAPALVPAADIAGRLLASRGSTGKAAKILQRTWKKSPHPDLALTYAYARPGDSPKDRLERVKALALTTPHTIEAPIALANAAIEAHDFETARKALKPLLDNRLTQRVCTLMARIEADEHGDAGRVREWLARAVNAPRDPTWTADGVTSEVWAPVSPVNGELDAFEWRVPVETAEKLDGAILTQKLEEFVALGKGLEPALEAKTQDIGDAAKDITPAPAAAKTADKPAAAARAAAPAKAKAATAAGASAAAATGAAIAGAANGKSDAGKGDARDAGKDKAAAEVEADIESVSIKPAADSRAKDEVQATTEQGEQAAAASAKPAKDVVIEAEPVNAPAPTVVSGSTPAVKPTAGSANVGDSAKARSATGAGKAEASERRDTASSSRSSAPEGSKSGASPAGSGSSGGKTAIGGDESGDTGGGTGTATATGKTNAKGDGKSSIAQSATSAASSSVSPPAKKPDDKPHGADKTNAAMGGSGKASAGKGDPATKEAQIFVPPRAPDDPGTEPLRSTNHGAPYSALRSRPVKG